LGKSRRGPERTPRGVKPPATQQFALPDSQSLLSLCKLLLDRVLLQYVVGLELDDNFLSVLLLSKAIGLYLLLLPLEVRVL